MADLSVATPPRATVAEQVYRALKKDLITLVHQPGAPLREQELADRYGSSRVPVREACRRLQQEGLVSSVPYKGYFASQVSLKEIADCFDLRLVLESHAVASATSRVTADELGKLGELASTEYTFHDRDTYIDFLDRNLAFHVELAALGCNDRLVALLSDLLEGMQRFFFLGLDLGDFSSEMRIEHEQLVAALGRGDPAETTAMVHDQITTSRERILRALVAGRRGVPLQ